MTKKFRQLSLQAKMSSIFILVNLVVFAVTVILILASTACPLKSIWSIRGICG